MLFRGLISLSVGLGERPGIKITTLQLSGRISVKSRRRRVIEAQSATVQEINSRPVSSTHSTKQFSIFFFLKPFYHLRASDTFEVTWPTAFLGT